MLTVKNTFKLFDVLNKHFKDDTDSRTCISEIEEIMDNKVDLRMNDFATRKDLGEVRIILKDDITAVRVDLKEDMSELRIELKQDMSNLQAELKDDMNNLRTELKEDMSNLRTELKQDINELRTDFQVLKADVNLSLGNILLSLERSQKEQLRWIVGAMVSMLGLMLSIFLAIFKII